MAPKAPVKAPVKARAEEKVPTDSPNSADPFAGTEEMIVVGSGGGSLLSAGHTSAIYFDSAGFDSSNLASAQFTPNLEMPDEAWNYDQYDEVYEAGFLRPKDSPLSTFSVDVDTASYANVRRFLREGQHPPDGAVRIEELVNYFHYSSAASAGKEPFSVDLEVFDAPWQKAHRLVRIAIEGRKIERKEVPPRNLVFLLDVSGSMQGGDRLPLVQYALMRLAEALRPIDRVSIVVYAGASGLVLPPTAGDQEATIVNAIERLSAGGSTAGAAGIRLAYETARKNFDPEGINRVILATDGDFNVGISNRSELIKLIEKERESGVYLTVLGVGRGNLNDAAMEQIADHGNGNYAYLDSRAEARRVLVEQADATLVAIAKDVKIQVEFNPSRVQAYRLIGYENRRLADQDFNDDTRDAGEIGSGHHVTALYEVVPVGSRTKQGRSRVDALKYSAPGAPTSAAGTGEWLTVKLRYKLPEAGADPSSRLLAKTLSGESRPLRKASENARFSSAVALFGMVLRDSEFRGEGDYALVEDLAREAMGEDERGERKEFLELVAAARSLK